MRRIFLIDVILVLGIVNISGQAAEKVIIAIDKTAGARVQFAGEKLSASLKDAGFDVNLVQSNAIPETGLPPKNCTGIN